MLVSRTQRHKPTAQKTPKTQSDQWTNQFAKKRRDQGRQATLKKGTRHFYSTFIKHVYKTHLITWGDEVKSNSNYMKNLRKNSVYL